MKSLLKFILESKDKADKELLSELERISSDNTGNIAPAIMDAVKAEIILPSK